jgi:hypothetical protein
MNIGSLAVSLVANTEPFTKGLKRAQSMLGSFQSKLATIGGALGFSAMLKNFESVGSELHDLSAATGISVENLDFFKYAAEQSGASLENFTKAARELQSKGIDPNRFLEIASSIAAIENPTQRAQKAFGVFGKKAGAPLLAMLKDLPALRKRFEELGGAMTTEMADKADELGDSLGDVKRGLLNIANAIAFDLAPAVTKANTFLANHSGIIRQWITDNGDIVDALGFTALAIGGVTFALGLCNKGIKAVTESIGLLKAAMSSGLVAKLLAVLGGLGAGGAAIVLGGIAAAFLGLRAAQNYMKPVEGVGNTAPGGVPGVTTGPSTAPTAPSRTTVNVDNTKIEKNTEAAANSLQALLAHMKAQGNESHVQSPPMAQPHIAIAGIH